MTDQSRKEWLLKLWNYHLGHLPEKDMQPIRTRLTQDVNARTDSERVLELIQQLRQTGHWDSSPNFPERVLAPLLKNDPGTGSRSRLIVAALALLIAMILVLVLIRATTRKKVSEPQPTTTTLFNEPAQVPTASPTNEKPQEKAVQATDSSALQLKVKSNLFGVAGQPSRASRELKDPVLGVESELDRSIQGPLPMSPLELHK